ncbi:MAG: SpoIID/LytB domain-containing protein [Myxococcota bacterium]
MPLKLNLRGWALRWAKRLQTQRLPAQHLPTVSLLAPRLSALLMGLLVILLASPAYARESPDMRVRVLVLDKTAEMTVEGLDLAAADARTGELYFNGKERAKVQLKAGVMLLNGGSLKSDRVWFDAPLIYLKLNGKEYRGPLEIRRDGSQLQAILHLSLESYLMGTVPGEMPVSWPLEALKAQAVVARTYAWMQVLRNENQTYDVSSDTRDQVYIGGKAEDPRVTQAIRFTEGIVLMRNDKLVEAFYHSTCGGATEVPVNVWPTATAEQPSVACDACRSSTHYAWELKLTQTELARLLGPAGLQGSKVTALEVVTRSDSGRALTLEIRADEGLLTLDGNTFRKWVGYGKLKSTRFTLQQSGETYLFSGTGFGHGAGMCQWGTRGQATQGKKAEEMLQHYYPGSVRVKLIPGMQTSVGELGNPGPEPGAAEPVPPSGTSATP